MMTEPSSSAAVAQLKEEGNKFFANKQYSQAYDKYSKALELGGDNAIIYANRSACCLFRGTYIDASSDARKATELDPDYAKAWGRLASAAQELGNLEEAISAYEKALSKLPQNHLSPAERRQKEHYETSINQVKMKIQDRHANQDARVHRVGRDMKPDAPYQRAKAIFLELKEGSRIHELESSSINTILAAGTQFEEGLKAFHEWRPGSHVTPSNIFERFHIVQKLTNAILSDRRCFYIDEPELLDKYNNWNYLIVESGGWNEGGPELVLEKAQKRIKEYGWRVTRQAISATVRGWIMRAFLVGGLNADHVAAEQFYRSAIDVIERGRKIWADVPPEDRGAIFDLTFLFGVRAIHLESFMQAHASTDGKNPRYSVEILNTLSRDLFLDIEKARKESGEYLRKQMDEGFYLSYLVYPAAEALAIKAYALKQEARGKEPEKAAQFWGESAEFYTQAANRYPKDDEYHCQYLRHALASWWWFVDVPLKTTLPLLAELKECVPKMKRIWEHSQLAMDGRDAEIQRCLDYYEEVQGKIDSGALTLDDVYNPPFQI